MRIEIISGSPRQASVTKRVALYIENWIRENTSHEVGLIDMGENEIPPLQTVWTSLEKVPSQFRTLASRMYEADAYILVSPEYNGSYSPAMKNLLDHFPKRHHKTFGIVTASPGAMGGIRAAQQLLLLVPALFGVTSPYMLIIPAVDKKFNAEGELLDESFQNAVHNFITEFLWLADKITPELEPVLITKK
jgi:NAD(P)H-dependent FMN reductase